MGRENCGRICREHKLQLVSVSRDDALSDVLRRGVRLIGLVVQKIHVRKFSPDCTKRVLYFTDFGQQVGE